MDWHVNRILENPLGFNNRWLFINQAPVVQTMDSVIYLWNNWGRIGARELNIELSFVTHDGLKRHLVPRIPRLFQGFIVKTQFFSWKSKP